MKVSFNVFSVYLTSFEFESTKTLSRTPIPSGTSKRDTISRNPRRRTASKKNLIDVPIFILRVPSSHVDISSKTPYQLSAESPGSMFATRCIFEKSLDHHQTLIAGTGLRSISIHLARLEGRTLTVSVFAKPKCSNIYMARHVVTISHGLET